MFGLGSSPLLTSTQCTVTGGSRPLPRLLDRPHLPDALRLEVLELLGSGSRHELRIQQLTCEVVLEDLLLFDLQVHDLAEVVGDLNVGRDSFSRPASSMPMKPSLYTPSCLGRFRKPTKMARHNRKWQTAASLAVLPLH